LPCVEQITPDDGHRRCPKHVEFYDKIKFWIFDAPIRHKNIKKGKVTLKQAYVAVRGPGG
jgi:hypothetical protein